MIALLEGEVVEKRPASVTLNVQGVGYEISIPLSTYEALAEVGKQTRLLTYMHVREDAISLFGFQTSEEKSMFRQLLSVSGIGPKLALGVLSGCSVQNLKTAIVNADIIRLSQLPGIGKKTAQRLSLELKDKLRDIVVPGDSPGTTAGEESTVFKEGVLALVSLGYSRSDAERSLSKILSAEPGLSVDQLVRRSLQKTV